MLTSDLKKKDNLKTQIADFAPLNADKLANTPYNLQIPSLIYLDKAQYLYSTFILSLSLSSSFCFVVHSSVGERKYPVPLTGANISLCEYFILMMMIKK